MLAPVPPITRHELDDCGHDAVPVVLSGSTFSTQSLNLALSVGTSKQHWKARFRLQPASGVDRVTLDGAQSLMVYVWDGGGDAGERGGGGSGLRDKFT